MKITNLKLPEMASYYICDDMLEQMRTKLLFNSDASVFGKEITLTMTNDNQLYKLLLSLKLKSEVITVGNRFAYEYELDINIPGGHLFEFDINGNTYKAYIYFILSEFDTLKVTFKISEDSWE